MAEYDLNTYVTLAELRQRMINNELVPLSEVADVLSSPLSIINDMMIGSGNDGDDDIVTKTLFEPQGSEVGYNQGAPVQHGQMEQVTEHSAIIEQPWEVETKIAKRTGNWRAYLDGEEILQSNGLRKRWEQRIFHGDRSATTANGARQINGLAVRTDYDTLNTVGTDDRPWVFDNAEGSTPSATANKSIIWFVKHSPIGFRWFYPQGQAENAGIGREFFGTRVKDQTDPVSSLATVMTVYNGRLTLAGGISIKDPRSVVPIVNISASGWDNDDDFDVNPGVLTDAMNYMDAITADIPGRTIIYMNSAIRARIWRLQSDLTLTRPLNEAFDQPEWMINGMPVHISNQISITGSRVTT